MLRIESTGRSGLLKSILSLAAFSLALSAAVPEGWIMSGSRPADYQSAVDSQVVYNGRPSAYLRYASPNGPGGGGFGTLMQSFGANDYIGQRVRFSGFVKSEAVQNWAGLWMRVDFATKTLSFDNMQNRPIKGTTDWQRYEVVLDVPDSAVGIAFGILLDGPGEVWLNSVQFDVVTPGVETTGRSPSLPDAPRNLGFDQ